MLPKKALLSLLSVLSIVSAPVPAATAAVEGNVAPLARATASSTRPGYPVRHVNDGDPKTQWGVNLGAKAGEWLRFDWPSAQTVSGVVLYPTGPYLASFDVEVSTPSGWKKLVHAGSPGLAKLRRVVLPVKATLARSLRLANLTPTPEGGPAFFEVEIYGDPAVLDRMAKEVDIAVSGDSRGNLIGTVSKDLGSTGLAGETVTVSGDSWTRTMTTGENGFFAVATPLDVHGKIKVDVKGHAIVVDATDIPLRLTARPKSGRLSLEGSWQILLDPPADWRSAPGWQPIDVPSNWEMKGLRAKSETAVMRKVFAAPKARRGERIKLRADGIYSKCEAWLNGVRVGSHDGGATPVEFDLTDAAKPGRDNVLDVFIWGRSPAAKIDNMSVYAYFEIAGIWRPIEVFTVEPAHVSRVSWDVDYDSAYANADLAVSATVANAQGSPAGDGKLSVRLLDPEGRVVKTETSSFTLSPWEEKTVPIRMHIEAPEPWTAERPRLYTLDVSFNGASVESPVGFREMEVRGKRFTINGKAAKLFGICLHSAD
ncbi:MAG: sugar-binding domain-containing protein, partial [Candidatus Aminicenantes bacterium RBG_16_66_30]